MKKILWIWLFVVGLLVLLFGTIYASLHYVIRSNANEPQIQIANDTAWKVANQAKQNGVAQPLSGEKIDVKNNLAPFVIVYNKDKQVYDSTGLINNQVPNLPPGVLDNTKEGEPHIFTWQPEDDVRIAAVTVSAGNAGYVLAGRSLYFAEQTIGMLNKFTVISFSVCVVFATVGLLLLRNRKII